MKTKNCDKLTEKYRHDLSNIQLGVDDTDHICFFCPKCKQPLEIIAVETMNNFYDGKTRENCTWIYMVCHNCKILGQRKFYWKSEDGRYCWQKTWKSKEKVK